MSTGAESGIQLILLAAGFARRFGRDKTLHPLHDAMPMALQTVHAVLQATPRLAVVLRPEQDALATLLAPLPLTLIRTSAAENGLGASLAAGVAATAQAPGGWIIALADMPYIRPATYGELLHRLAAARPDALIAPSHRGQRGHPVAFGPAWGTALCRLQGDTGARALLHRHAGQLQLFASDDPGVLLDIDTEADLRATDRPDAPARP